LSKGKNKLENALVEIRDSLIGLDIEATKMACRGALKAGLDPFRILNEALTPALNEVGRRFEAGEYFLAELIMAGEIMKEAMEALEPSMMNSKTEARGSAIIGTVSGDLHSIGKDIVVTLLRANGLQVYDLGVDVPVAKFVEEVKGKKPDILAMSALLTTSLPEMGKTIRALEEIGMRSVLKIIVGGSPVSPEFAREIGADYASRDAVEGVNVCLEWIKRKYP
jgi:methanogenic corrinoid protein MtbC1